MDGKKASASLFLPQQNFRQIARQTLRQAQTKRRILDRNFSQVFAAKTFLSPRSEKRLKNRAGNIQSKRYQKSKITKQLHKSAFAMILLVFYRSKFQEIQFQKRQPPLHHWFCRTFCRSKVVGKP